MGVKQQGSSQSSTTTQTGPWSVQAPYLADAFSQAQTNYGTAKNNQYYTGQTVAPLNDAQNTALGSTIATGSQPNAGVSAAGQNLTDTLNGTYLNPATNPYLTSTYNAAAAPVTASYMTATAPQTAGAAEAAGRYGSGSYQNQVKQQQLGLGTTLNNLATNIYGGNYQQERQNQIADTGQAGGVNSAQYINPTAALTAGNQQQQQQQNVDQSNLAAYQFNQQQPTTALNNYIAQIQGNYGSTGQSTTSTPYYSNPGATALGGVLGLGSLATPGLGGTSALGNIFGKGAGGGAGAGLSALGLPSDRRLKTDIRLIGKSFDGQNIYTYRFKGSAKTELGLMAQEVRERIPEAVAEHPDGYLMVDYAKALEAA